MNTKTKTLSLTESQKRLILDGSIGKKITRRGVSIGGPDNGSFLYIYGDWMTKELGRSVFIMSDGNDLSLFWVFDLSSKIFLGMAKKVLPVRAMQSPAAPVDLKKIEIDCLMKICARKDVVIEQQAEMIETLEKKLFLALNKVHPMQRRRP